MHKYHCESCDTLFAMLAKKASDTVSCPKCENLSRKRRDLEEEASASAEASARVYGFG